MSISSELRRITGIKEPVPKVETVPRPVFENERKEWLAGHAEPDARDLKQVSQILYNRNPVRVRRIMKDINWMREELIKLNRDPEDWKWLL